MNAGELNIRIAADLATIDGQFRQVERMAASAGDKAASAFMNAKQFLNIGSQLAGAIEVGLKEGFENGAQAGAIAFAKALPIIGGAFSAGLGAGEQIARLITEYGRMEASLEARSLELEQRRAEAVKVEQKARQDQQRIADTAVGNAALQRRLDAQNAKAAGDERRAAMIESIASEETIIRERDLALAKAVSDEEKRLIREQATLRIALNNSELAEKYKAIQEREDSAAEKRRREEEAERKRRLDEIRQVESDRIRAQQAGMSEVQTAIGAFRFDAYPAQAKAANDARMVALLTAIAGNTARSGGFI